MAGKAVESALLTGTRPSGVAVAAELAVDAAVFAGGKEMGGFCRKGLLCSAGICGEVEETLCWTGTALVSVGDVVVP